MTKNVRAPFLVGIILVKSAKMARYMNEHIPGIHVPDEIIQEVDDARDKEKKAVEIAVRLIRELKPMAEGVHLMPIVWGHLLPEVIEQAKQEAKV